MTGFETFFRWAQESDYDLLGEVLFDAVRNSQSAYSPEQREVWAPAPPFGPQWRDRLRAQDIIVAEANGDILGFMSLARLGYVDFAFIRPQAQRSGLFKRLYGYIFQRAAERSEPRLWTHASLMAEPPFRGVGFTVLRREVVHIGDQSLDRYEMENHLVLNGRRVSME